MAVQAETNEQQPIAIAIHGGAGTITRENMSPETGSAILNKHCKTTLDAGYAILEQGGEKSIDAVIAAIQLMEEKPRCLMLVKELCTLIPANTN